MDVFDPKIKNLVITRTGYVYKWNEKLQKFDEYINKESFNFKDIISGKIYHFEWSHGVQHLI